MLNDLTDLQESEEQIWELTIDFDVRTRSEEQNELIERVYTFSYAKEWDKWMFREFEEERTPDNDGVSDREWARSRHVSSQDLSKLDTIDIPPEVSESLAEATGAEEIVLQVPKPSLSNEYEVVQEVDGS